MEKHEDFKFDPIAYKCDQDAAIKVEVEADFHKLLKRELEDDVRSSQVMDGKCFDSVKIKEETWLNTNQEVETSSTLKLYPEYGSNNVSDHLDNLIQNESTSYRRKVSYPTSNDSKQASNQEHTKKEISSSKVSRKILVAVDNGQAIENLGYELKLTGDKPYKCDLCSASFTHSSSVKRHKRLHTGEKPYKCVFCTSAFANASSLTVHNRQHTGEKPYTCDICPSAFAQKYNLTSHKRQHTGEKPYKCDICLSVFSNSSNLSVHKRQHTGEKPYKCVFCPSAFANASSLTVHNRQHTGEKPYTCDICPSAFAQKYNLTIHKRQHTGEKPYKCDICLSVFSNSSNLSVHKRQHTENLTTNVSFVLLNLPKDII